MFVAGGLELDQASPQAAGGPNPVTSQIAKAIAAIKLRIKCFLLARKNVSRLSEQKALIEKELYGNRYRHRSKSDDDLPIVRESTATRRTKLRKAKEQYRAGTS